MEVVVGHDKDNDHTTEAAKGPLSNESTQKNIKVRLVVHCTVDLSELFLDTPISI